LHFEALKLRFLVALEALVHNDRDLLELHAGERSIVGRLQIYVQGVFPSYHIDTEYNRAGVDPKRVRRSAQCMEFAGTVLVVPDLVIHRRGTNSSNLLVVEVKRGASQSEVECDQEKLVAIKTAFRYEHSLLIKCPRTTLPGRSLKFHLEWDRGGFEPLIF
jgi:hypothetical protein